MSTSKICVFVHLAHWPFDTVQNRRSTTIEVKYCVYLSITSCGRQELNECLLDRCMFVDVKVEISVSSLVRLLRTGIQNRPRKNPILATGSRSRGAQTDHPWLPWAHLLGSLAQPGSGLPYLQLTL